LARSLAGRHVLAFTSRCRLVWAQRLGGSPRTAGSGDLSGAGALAVVEGTNNQHGGGSVYALNGATGAVMWRQSALGEVIGGGGHGGPGLGLPGRYRASTGGAEVLDGKTGAVLAILERGVGLQNCALVTMTPTARSGSPWRLWSHRRGVVQHYQLVGSSGANVAEAGAWPMFHHDPYLTGNARRRPAWLSAVGGTQSREEKGSTCSVIVLGRSAPYDEYHHDGPGGRGGANGQQPASTMATLRFRSASTHMGSGLLAITQ